MDINFVAHSYVTGEVEEFKFYEDAAGWLLEMVEEYDDMAEIGVIYGINRRDMISISIQ